MRRLTRAVSKRHSRSLGFELLLRSGKYQLQRRNTTHSDTIGLSVLDTAPDSYSGTLIRVSRMDVFKNLEVSSLHS